MKRLVAVSDSHGMTHSLMSAVKLAMQKSTIDIFVFLGDGASDMAAVQPLLLQHNPRIQIICVCGNNDFSSDLPSAEEFLVCGRVFYATHGHHHRVKYSMTRLSYAAQERGAAVALYGHTHCSRLEEANGCWFINPGAVCRPATNGCAYAEISIEENGFIHPQLISWTGTAL